MAPDSLSFETIFSTEVVARAALAFREYQFQRYGRLLSLCCVVNVLGLGLAFWAGAKLDATIWFLIFVVLFGPLWLAYKYFAGPHVLAARLRLVLATSGRVTVSSALVSLPGRSGQELSLPWSSIKVVHDADNLFLLVLSPLFAFFIPKVGMPEAAQKALLSKVQPDAA